MTHGTLHRATRTGLQTLGVPSLGRLLSRRSDKLVRTQAALIYLQVLKGLSTFSTPAEGRGRPRHKATARHKVSRESEARPTEP
ncbi:hypothetical protein GCM10009744_03380 [Kribbella alba]|uniref:Uncharacterized protein n=1 Tax=Kribbella alba TaxID=190197 RepID=A0ABN2EWJ5_9ACTN